MKKKSTRDILQAPRGMRDFFGEEFLKRKNFLKAAEKIADHYGFSGIETPVMEHTEIFQKGVGEGTDIVDKEMFTLTTEGGDKLTLRPEGTASIMRAYIEHGMGSLPQPLMFYYSGAFFRHEKPQKGRYRQLYQFGLEIMGSENPLHDTLIIQTGYEIIKKTGKEIMVGINSLGNNEERKKYIDDLTKFYKQNEDNIAESDKKRIESNPLRILDSKEELTISVNKKAPLLLDQLGTESREYFDKVLEYLDAAHIPHEINPSLVRGLDYYEHTVFEYATHDDEENTLALGGGGRYDGLAETIGHNKPVPSVGLGLGVDRIIEASLVDSFLEEKKKNILFITLDEKSHIYSLVIAKELQDRNVPIQFNFSSVKASKQFEKAEKLGMEYALILGEEEIDKKIVLLKNLETKEQREIKLSEIEIELENL